MDNVAEIGEENNFIEKSGVFCKICQKNTIYSSKVFFQLHVSVSHGITSQQYYDSFDKKDDEGVCKVCGGPTKFIKYSQGYREFCSSKCTQSSKQIRAKIEQTNMERYGDKCSAKNELVIKKRIRTTEEKYGSEHYFSSEEFKKNRKPLTQQQSELKSKRTRSTNLEKYGCVNVFQNEDVKKKIKDTNLNRYGVENFNQTEEGKSSIKERYKDESWNEARKNKIKETKLINYISNLKNIIPDNFQVVEYNRDRHILKCDVGHEFQIQHQLIRVRKNKGHKICTVCNPLSNYSNAQNDVADFIRSIYDGEIVTNHRKIFNGRSELDVYLPELNLAFEYNGLYWHSELNKSMFYHFEKTESCESKGIHLVHIYEDDWIFKREIVESRILNLLMRSDRKIYARKCQIKEIDFKEAESFLNDNHIQGNCISKYRFGLYCEGELVSLMSFGELRVNLSSVKKTQCYELLRFCNKNGTSVIGAASKLLKYFLNMFDPLEIISYADRSWSMGELYKILGFEFVRNTRPNYWYIIDGKRENRFKYRKDVLVSQGFDPMKTEKQIMSEREIYRIYDSGSKLYRYTK